VVDVGDTVTVGEAVARAPEGALGVPIHASINGTVRAVNDTIVIEQ
jgi:Na+-translocating ferredoxin:NAD+ oxidoreductase RnfC subunit